MQVVHVRAEGPHQMQHALNQRSPAEGKGQKHQMQHTLNQRSPAEGKGQKHQMQYALKGQKLLAQGNALGIYGRKPVAL